MLINQLTPVCRIGTTVNKARTPIWKFQCSCGNYTIGTLVDFRRNVKKSCGCIKTKRLSLLHKNNTTPQNVREQICNRYSEGESIKLIASKFNLHKSTVTKILKESGMQTFSRRERNIQFNEFIFDNLNADSLYWLGFIAADGHVGSNCLVITISKKDINHLYKFKIFVEGNSNLKIREYNKSCSIVLYSKHIVNTLRNYGFFNDKSVSLRIDNRFTNSRDFWRGMIDGDGCLLIDKRGQQKLNFCGTKSTTKSFSEWCKKYVNTNSKIRLNGASTLNYQFNIHCKKAAQISEILYGGSPRFYLERKYQKYKEFISG